MGCIMGFPKLTQDLNMSPFVQKSFGNLKRTADSLGFKMEPYTTCLHYGKIFQK